MKWALKCGRENTEHRIVFLTRSRSFPVQPAKKQQQREESGLASLFLMALFLNSLFDTQGKIAMDGNFSHIAPWKALYDDPFGIHFPSKAV
ncbi:MAG: hypothetical protein NC412_06715 [Roseburia sp.]|nr:hypothetical protein [Roseburia sp.]MCM1279709.1 hypothetical protein [Robinsoniella sp.]